MVDHLTELSGALAAFAHRPRRRRPERRLARHAHRVRPARRGERLAAASTTASARRSCCSAAASRAARSTARGRARAEDDLVDGDLDGVDRLPVGPGRGPGEALRGERRRRERRLPGVWAARAPGSRHRCRPRAAVAAALAGTPRSCDPPDDPFDGAVRPLDRRETGLARSGRAARPRRARSAPRGSCRRSGRSWRRAARTPRPRRGSARCLADRPSRAARDPRATLRPLGGRPRGPPRPGTRGKRVVRHRSPPDHPGPARLPARAAWPRRRRPIAGTARWARSRRA